MPDNNTSNIGLLPAVAQATGGSAPLRATVRSALPEWAANPADETFDWRRYWSAILRNRWWVVAGTVLGLGMGVSAARLLKPLFRVQATVWIDVDRQNANRGPIRQGQLLEAGAWVDLLRSYAVLDNVVHDLRLYVNAASPADSLAFSTFDVTERFRPGRYRLVVDKAGKTYTLLSERVVMQRGNVGDPIGLRLGFVWTPPPASLQPGQAIVFDLVTLRDAAQRLAQGMNIRLDDASNYMQAGNFMRLELTGTNPAGLATTLDAITKRCVTVAADLKRAKLTELTHILNEQLATAGQNLREAEQALEGFRVRTITLPSEQATPVVPGLEATRDPVFRNFFEMRIEREQLRRDRDAIAHTLAQLSDSDASVQGLEAIGSVQRSTQLTQALRELTGKQAELRASRYQYTAEHPTQKRLVTEIATLQGRTIPVLARELLGQIGTRQQVLDSLVQSAGFELREIPQRAVEEARLRREVAIAENLYTTLQQRYEEARLAEASTIPDIRVLDPAVAPHRPIKNTAHRFIVVGLLAGFGLSILGVVLADRLDRRLHYPQQVTREMGLAIIGAVPRFNQRRDGPAADDVTQVVEALRTVRLNVAHAYGGHPGPIVITITSPGPGDGKSFVAGNLARAFADAGQRTLLIDGDTRRGVLHRMLNTVRKPGLVDHLTGSAPLERIVQKTDHPLLEFVGSGARQGDTPELLSSQSMARFLAYARNAYEVILVDSPPLGAGVDPFVLGTLTGSLLLVLRTGSTDRELAASKLEGIDRLPIRVLGAVLNDVQPRGVYRYYGYLTGYSAEAEPQVATIVRR